MSYGMTYDEFWHGKPILAKMYREKHRIDVETRNQELWLQGLYFYDAICVALNNSFSKKKEKYVAEPFKLFPKTEGEIEREKEEVRRKFVERLNKFADEFNKSKQPKTE